MAFAYVTDIHGNLSAVRELVEQSKRLYPKLRYILVGGDLTRKPDWNEDWVKAKNASISEACSLFSGLELETYFILGNDDIESPAVPMDRHNFHGMINDVVSLGDGIGLLGFSYVPPTPFLTRYERDENELKQMLEPLFKELSKFKFKIAMCHAPPYGTNLDVTKDWYPGGKEMQVHAGSKAVRKLIERYQPDVGLFGHLHESAGSCRLGRTLCVNPGASSKAMRGCVFSLDLFEGIGEFEIGSLKIEAVL
jgi:Icc-related predicted phosphoesterase